MRAIGMIDAAYPSGSHGNVVLIWRLPIDEVFGPDDDTLEELIKELQVYYHTQIGPAYSPDDFTYTFWMVADLGQEMQGESLMDLIGVQILRAPNHSDTVRPA